MAIGVYGVTRSSDVDINDISMYYNYVPNRETLPPYEFFTLTPGEVLSYNYLPVSEEIVGNENLLEGVYNLKLPATIFNQLGIYTIYIKPKTYTAVVVDCSVLSSLPSVKGIVLNINDLPEKLRANNALQGYRIEYIEGVNKLRNVVRYVATSNIVVPVSENVGNTSQKAIRYRFDNSGSLIFLQLTPSSSSDVKPNVLPFIGNPGQTIILSNTFFSPLVIEVDLVKNTIDTLANILAGNQVKDVQKGGVPVRGGVADQSSIWRVDVFNKAGKFYLIPIYQSDRKKNGVLPNRAATANTPRDEWTLIDASFDFSFSLFPNDLIKLQNRDTTFFGYFVGLGVATASISIKSHDNNETIATGKAWQGIWVNLGVKVGIQCFEKFHVDVLGNFFPAMKEKRRDLA